jgi:hypothetical protein
MRTIVWLLLIACGPPTIPITEKVTTPTNMQDAGVDAKPAAKPTTTTPTAKPAMVAGPGTWKVGPGDFPLPGDADDGTQMVNNLVYQIPRPRDSVHEELVKHLTANGYTIQKDTLFMGGYRMEITNKEGRRYDVSVTENDEASTIMQVSPK